MSKKQALNKKQKIDLDNVVCPITKDMFNDPMMAEDGIVYDKSGLEALVAHEGSDMIKSPLTRQLMSAAGSKLVLPLKHFIGDMVRSNVITGDMANVWKAKEKEKLAQAGNEQAMFEVGLFYERGSFGFTKDLDKAFFYYDKVSKTKHPASLPALAKKAEMIVEGNIDNHDFDYCTGAFELGIAVERGSKYAMLIVARYMANGTSGFNTNKPAAKALLEEALTINVEEESKESLILTTAALKAAEDLKKSLESDNSEEEPCE